MTGFCDRWCADQADALLSGRTVLRLSTNDTFTHFKQKAVHFGIRMGCFILVRRNELELQGG
jgi:hypothetical protein